MVSNTMISNGERVARAFIDAFNAQDHVALAGTLNYPHTRLANGRFWQVDSAEQFVAASKGSQARLLEEGWDHTIVSSLKVFHQGLEKEHIAMTNDRCDKDGSVYNSFDTLWIATLQDGHWGIQFRSSFLK